MCPLDRKSLLIRMVYVMEGALAGYVIGWIVGWAAFDPDSDLWALGGLLGGLAGARIPTPGRGAVAGPGSGA